MCIVELSCFFIFSFVVILLVPILFACATILGCMWWRKMNIINCVLGSTSSVYCLNFLLSMSEVKVKYPQNVISSRVYHRTFLPSYVCFWVVVFLQFFLVRTDIRTVHAKTLPLCQHGGRAVINKTETKKIMSGNILKAVRSSSQWLMWIGMRRNWVLSPKKFAPSLPCY